MGLSIVVLLSQVGLDFLFSFPEDRVVSKVVDGVVPDLGCFGVCIGTSPEPEHDVVVDLLVGVARNSQTRRQSFDRIELGDPVDIAYSDRIGIPRYIPSLLNLHS